jgi:hypothetical protein
MEPRGRRYRRLILCVLLRKSCSGALREPTCLLLVDFGHLFNAPEGRDEMHGIIYLIGLVVVILAVLSLFGLR